MTMPPASAGPVEKVLYEVKKTIVGQDVLLERLLVALLARGHILVEGVPGLAKTLAVKSLAEAIGGEFHRVQFTPDLVPADILGTRVYHQPTGEFQVSLGPVFTNLLLADEINRAPAKVQSALLEVMQERQVTIGRETHLVPNPFLVMATQNPIEYQGTFPLPESQLDRFLMSLSLGYPPRADERDLLLSGGVEDVLEHLKPVVSEAELLDLQERVGRVRVADKLADYMLSLAEVTRHGGDFLLGVSTRGLQALFRATQALALCEGRGYAIPDDVQRLVAPVLAHRVVLKRGSADLEQSRKAIERVVAATPVPL